MKEYDTLDDAVRNEWGIVDSVFRTGRKSPADHLSAMKNPTNDCQKVKRYR
jgi:hypothetical protein